MLHRAMTPPSSFLLAATAAAQRALGYGVQNVWVETPTPRSATKATDYLLFEQQSYLGGLLPVGRTQRGAFRLAIRHTDDPIDPKDPTWGSHLQGCGDPDVKGTYATLEHFCSPDFDDQAFLSKEPALSGRGLETAALLTAHVWEVMDEHDVEYIEGDIFSGQGPMFQACGWSLHKYRHLWVSARRPPQRQQPTHSNHLDTPLQGDHAPPNGKNGRAQQGDVAAGPAQQGEAAAGRAHQGEA